MPKVETRLIWGFSSSRRVAVYGEYVTFGPVRQRYWIRRRDGIKQRYWKKTTRMARRGPVRSGRFEFYGRGKSVYRAVALAHEVMPDGHVEVSAEEFLRNPYKYGVEGYWIDKEIESR